MKTKCVVDELKQNRNFGILIDYKKNVLYGLARENGKKWPATPANDSNRPKNKLKMARKSPANDRK